MINNKNNNRAARAESTQYLIRDSIGLPNFVDFCNVKLMILNLNQYSMPCLIEEKNFSCKLRYDC